MSTDTISLADELKSATAEAHRNAETRPLQKQLVQGALPLPTMAGYLAQLMLVHRALETELDKRGRADTAVESLWSGLARHSDHLALDIADFGLAADAVQPLAPTLAFIAHLERSDVPALIGALYVLEGSMNGNRFIAAGIRRARPEIGDETLRYFDPYGEAQRPTWMTFRERLDGCGFDEAARAAVLASAEATFEAVGAISDASLPA